MKSATEQERDRVLRCMADAVEAIRVVPGADPNGALLVWLADQFLQIDRRGEKTS